ncbi:kinase-like protein [Xylona heveae TC161]|uniref:non-specific serine/threonine protein kinase n=1 Tax=Xylona heveae (strain CBS 132557 / TC161) TaxID=1328760 RepID=A0A165HMK4_XYLHT|nr:kinase-like protein [Xylona heveae TC161]KZF23739.1 kinase-like protein [Xylona heveae TC161]
MAESEQKEFLLPPAVVALKEGRPRDPSKNRVTVERTLSADIREGREDLKEAAEQTLVVILDVDLDGVIRWVTPSWRDVIGTAPESVQGRPISDVLLDNKNAFADAAEFMKKDDSRSHIIRFSVRMGPDSRLKPNPIDAAVHAEEEGFRPEEVSETEGTSVISLEAQGILVYDRTSGEVSHTMWMVRPSARPREITIDLPPMLVEALGIGAEVLAQYLTKLAEVGVDDPENLPPPLPVLCRICERQITPWWFEKHSELCLQEHRAELEVQMAQEGLIEHRNAIVKVLDALEVHSNRSTPAEMPLTATVPAEYRGLPIGPSSTPSSSGPSSGAASPAVSGPRSRESSTSGLGHARGRSFAIRRPLTRIVELLLDLCDTSIEINTPAIKDSKGLEIGEIRVQSPQSDSRISQVMQWQSPGTNTLEQEQGLAALCADTEVVARAKVDAVMRHRKILEYSERIRVEFTVLVQDCIDAAVRKAARIAAGQLSDSTDDGEDEEEEEVEADEDGPMPDDRYDESVRGSEIGLDETQEQASAFTDEETGGIFAGSFDGHSSLARALRNLSDPSLGYDRRKSSAAISTGSNSPREAATPRSYKGAVNINAPSQLSQQASLNFESDANDSDASMRSSVIPGIRRTESPITDFSLGRTSASRERSRSNLSLPGQNSPRRQPSPARNVVPSSPLRISKPRLSAAQEIATSPIISPLLSTGEFSSPAFTLPPQHHALHHHRRQSSAASSDMMRPPPSPRLSSISQPQAPAVPPSIKDFEIIKPISKGAFGSVYLVKKKVTGDYYAMKVLKKADMVAKNQVTNVKAERAILMWQGESDFVAKLYWTFSSKDYLYLVMEYLNGGDCASLIKVLGGLPEDWAKKYLAEVVLGVQHLHNRGIVHRDLKPDNLLIDQKGHLKLTDFGLSRMGLIGRQKRILDSKSNDSGPDLLKQSSFIRSASMASSRSASFDLQGGHSPGSTPHLTPDPGLSQPSYFSLSRESTLGRESSFGRENSRRTSGHRSDSGGSEALHSMFRNFSLSEPLDYPQSMPRWRTPIEEETQSENEESGGDPYALHPTLSHSSLSHMHTPPQSTMIAPPPMALFDPGDKDRRFVGTPDYLAPETISGVGQDEMSDWWSLGCILFEFLFGYPPFHADTPDKVFDNILARRIDWPTEEEAPVSPEARDLMERLMCSDPKTRLGSNLEEKYANGGEEVQRHPWFEGVTWDTLLEDEAQFVPAPGHPEDTEYFDPRGAILQTFAEEFEDQASPAAATPGGDYQERPHDALSKVRNQVNSIKRGMMPLHIPPHVRDGRSRRLSEPVATDDFGNFAFKNLPVLEKANRDVIQKLRADALNKATQLPNAAVPPPPPPPSSQSQGSVQTPASAAASSSSNAPSLDGSPMLPMPLKRTLSSSKGARPASPSNASQANSSPSRASQPSSPLLVSFSTGQHHERRKTSSSSSIMSTSQPNAGLQPSFFDLPRLSTSFKTASTASSPIKTTKNQPPLQVASPEKSLIMPHPHPHRQSGSVPPRARSQTVGSQDSDRVTRETPLFHHKRRSQVIEASPSSSDNEDPRTRAFLRVQRRRQSSRKLSHASLLVDGPVFRPLDVLICEDHPVSRMVMERLLEKLRCRTIAVPNGSEAMRYAMGEVKFDVIMMESKLPHINGADVARMIRDTKNVNSQTPIVAVTGYLKDLQAPHSFDALIEKPPTISKLTEVMSRLCQWKPPQPGLMPHIPTPSFPPSNLRQESRRDEDSPSSNSSGFAQLPEASYHASSRDDSISSSFFGDNESALAEDIPVVISRQQGDDWAGKGLGIISAEEGIPPEPSKLSPKLTPHLIHANSAPPAMSTRLLKSPKSMELIKAKRTSLERYRHESAESGDDEDEELGRSPGRPRSPARLHRNPLLVAPPRSPVPRVHRGSRLGIEMMRTSSQESEENAVSESEDQGRDDDVTPTSPRLSLDREPPICTASAPVTPPVPRTTLTPPEVFSKTLGGKQVKGDEIAVDIDADDHDGSNAGGSAKGAARASGAVGLGRENSTDSGIDEKDYAFQELEEESTPTLAALATPRPSQGQSSMPSMSPTPKAK